MEPSFSGCLPHGFQVQYTVKGDLNTFLSYEEAPLATLSLAMFTSLVYQNTCLFLATGASNPDEEIIFAERPYF